MIRWQRPTRGCARTGEPPPRVALTIAGTDSGGGAGIAADLRTFHALGVFGTLVVTAVTAQNTQAVSGVEILSAAFVDAQLDAVLADFTNRRRQDRHAGDDGDRRDGSPSGRAPARSASSSSTR